AHRSRRHGAAKDHQHRRLPGGTPPDRSAERVSRAHNIGKIESSLSAPRTDADEGNVGIGCTVQSCSDDQTVGAAARNYDILNARLVERRHAVAQQTADVIVLINADDTVPVAKKSCRRDDTYVTKTDNGDLHRHTKSTEQVE